MLTAVYTSVMSREAAAALMCRLGWRTVLVQSNERANVPIDLHTEMTNIMNFLRAGYVNNKEWSSNHSTKSINFIVSDNRRLIRISLNNVLIC